MKHLFICREYPPAAYPPGGIGTYVRQITDLLAKAGETVHVIAHRWAAAPHVREDLVEGRLIVHRVALDEPLHDKWAVGRTAAAGLVPRGLLASSFPSQAFSWQAALLAERLIESDGIDVIEAQEWEAPLYYFQLRRSLNLGPSRRPPCVVHLHSPSEQIFRANAWDTTVADYLPAVMMEEYSITNADALLCPSRFLAEQVVTRYRIDPRRLSVIPYPLGNAPQLDRSARTWSTPSICYVGRLEARKGVLEWAEAVASLAAEQPNLKMEFVGGDTPLGVTGGPTVGDAIRARLPRGLRRHFRFHGSLDRSGTIEVLSRVCAAAVPSRWENFPYSCIEAMGSGLPVIASPNGGMAELVTDGVSGWIASDSTPVALASALRRALETPAVHRERMGTAAMQTVRRICDNETIVRRHLDVKEHLVRSDLRPSVRASQVFDSEVSINGATQPAVFAPSRCGFGVIVTDSRGGLPLESCMSSVQAQTEPPTALLGASIKDAAPIAWQLLTGSHPALVGLAFVDGRVRLDPEFLRTCRMLFAENDRLGLVGAWTLETRPRERLRVQPCPAIPYMWNDEQVAPYIVVRAAAFERALVWSGEVLQEQSLKNICGNIVRAGWMPLTYPAVLAAIELDRDDPAARHKLQRYSSLARAVQRLHTPLLRWLLATPKEDRRALVSQTLLRPGRTARWVAARAIQSWRLAIEKRLPSSGETLSDVARRSR